MRAETLAEKQKRIFQKAKERGAGPAAQRQRLAKMDTPEAGTAGVPDGVPVDAAPKQSSVEIPEHVPESTALWLLKRMCDATSLKGIGEKALLNVTNHFAPLLSMSAKDITCGNFAGLSSTVVRDQPAIRLWSAERLNEFHAAVVLRFPPQSTQSGVAGPAEADLSLTHQSTASAESATSQSTTAPPGVCIQPAVTIPKDSPPPP